MTSPTRQLWDRFRKYNFQFPTLGLSVDLSRMNFDAEFLERMRPRMAQAFAAMAALEGGAVVNTDENRMVGHYWLRNPALAPNDAIRSEIESAQREIDAFAAAIHGGEIRVSDRNVNTILVIGIGGSALGPQFIASALGHPRTERVRVCFLDNTDPDGIERVLASIGLNLSNTLAVVISKSGGTKETRNGMVEAAAAFKKAGLHFPAHAVAVTKAGSDLDKLAIAQGWLKRFPMWDWVGGRTSITSAVGLLPAQLQGFDAKALLAGAKACDDVTRVPEIERNPAAQLALMWFHAGAGRGAKDMVVIPYKDRLELFSKYLQQLVMESLGKELDVHKKRVNQGIAVYGNKGSTDQHAYIQQLRDGINNFFVTFIRVLREGDGASLMVEPNVTSGDYLDGFLLGTRQALFENGRESITLTIDRVSPFSIGVLIALYERAVGLYASLVEINAYHQPGVEAGKKAAEKVLEIQQQVLSVLAAERGAELTVEQIAARVGPKADVETIYHILEHLAANPERGVQKTGSSKPGESRYRLS